MTEHGRENITIGFVSTFSTRDKHAMSGTVYSTFNFLDALKLNVIPLYDITLKNSSNKKSLINFFKRAYRFFSIKLKKPNLNKQLAEKHRHGKELGSKITKKLEESRADIIVALNASKIIPHLKTKIPIVYVSDYTAKLYYETYHETHSLDQNLVSDELALEQASLEICSIFSSPSNVTLTSAAKDYGVPRSKLRFSEYGANIVPQTKVGIKKNLPTKNQIRLITIAGNPKRKQVLFSLYVTEALQKKGWNAHLTCVGPPTVELQDSPFATCAGSLNLSDESDRRQNEHIFEESHWFILPSLAEAFGIAAVEAAHFGCPSIVSEAGGLPDAVSDGKSGFVMQMACTPEDYCEKIIEVSENPLHYTSISAHALELAQTKLNWHAWAKSIESICREIKPSH